ncbi:MAG: hypothetical protein ACFFD2_22215 [Promethearchaeota archaeon]
MSTGKDEEKEITKEEVIKELEESVGNKLVMRREAPIIGVICFSAALWGSKIFTSSSPGTSIIFTLFGAEIHFHHFHYGIIALIIGIILTFIEGPWVKRIAHGLFGAGLGFIIDEYWMLLTMDDSSYNYFGPNSQWVSITIGIVITAIYVAIVVILYFFTRRERKIWTKFYEAVKSGKIKIEF